MNRLKARGEARESKGLGVSAKSYVTSIALIFALMVLAYILVLVLPGGEYTRLIDADGNTIIDETSFHEVDGGLPFWKWILSPILVLGSSSGGTLIAVLIFLLIIGGIFNALNRCGIMRYMLDLITYKFGDARYKLLAIVALYFMLDGTLIGSFEECVPLVPIVVALSISLGWDAITGVAMSLLAAGCGFAAGICNPFTVGVAQKLAGLPMFGGIWLRIVSFVLIYALLMTFVITHAKRVERSVDEQITNGFVSNHQMNKALLSFAIILGTGILTVLCSPFIPVLQDLTMVIVALMYLVAGIVSVKVAGFSWKKLGTFFVNGAVSLLPAVAMVMMASSIKFILEESCVLDTILHGAATLSATFPVWAVILAIYAITLVMNFFVPSGSAKAFMLIPILVPLANLFGIPAQLVVVAFAFGDGFSNVFYPTNPVLLISLGLTNISYGAWFKWVWKFQLINLVMTSCILLFGLLIGYC